MSNDTNTDDAETKSPMTRWIFTNDILAAVLVVGYTGLLFAGSAGFIDLSAIPKSMIEPMVAFTGIGVAWLFGPKAVEAWKSLKEAG